MKKNNKKILIPILLIVIILLVLVYVSLLFNKNTIISKINNNIFDNSLKEQKGITSWIMDNNQRICLTNGEYLLNKDKSSIEETNNKLSKLFIDLGFTKNLKNSYEVEDDFRNLTIGYEKNNTKCIISWHKDIDYQSISCADITTEDEENHSRFYNLINVDKNESTLVCVDKQNEEFARGSISFWRTGAEWYAKKENKEWKLLLKTQDYLQCFFAEQLPEGFYDYDFCYPDK